MLRRLLWSVGIWGLSLLIPMGASAAIGELYIGSGANFVVYPSELDPITDQNYLIGTGVGINFNVYRFNDFEFILGTAFFRQDIDEPQEAYKQFEFDLTTMSINLELGLNYTPYQWLSAGVALRGGALYSNLTMNGRFYNTEIEDELWTWQIEPALRLGLFLPKAALASWQPWEGFNFGIRFEVGYLYIPELDFDVVGGRNLSDDNTPNSRDADLGTLDIQGVGVRGFFVWQF